MSKVWFITGAGSGIGTGTARAALRAGDSVVATGRNLDKVRDALSDAAGERLALVRLDVSDEAQAKAAVTEAVERFGRIDVLVNNAVVEPGFFRTDLLDERNVRFAGDPIEDYADEGDTRAAWAQYHGAQLGDPVKLGDVLVKIAGMESPPKLFVAGSDALGMITPAVEGRLREMRADVALTRSTDGSFQREM